MSHRVDGYIPPATGANVDGYATTISGQYATGLNGHGGKLILRGGVGSADGYDGYVYLETGNRILLVLDGYNVGYFPTGVTGSFGSGKNVVFIANATTVPSVNPTGGGILYVENGALKYIGSNGTITTLGPA
jgi:hypothetical protein